MRPKDYLENIIALKYPLLKLYTQAKADSGGWVKWAHFYALRAQFFCASRELTQHCYVPNFVFFVSKKNRPHLAKILYPPLHTIVATLKMTFIKFEKIIITNEIKNKIIMIIIIEEERKKASYNEKKETEKERRPDRLSK